MKLHDNICHGLKVYRFQPCHETDGSLRGKKISPEELWFSTPKNLNDPMDIDHPLDDLMRGEGGDSLMLREMAKVMYAQDKCQYPRHIITDHLLFQIQNWAEAGGHSLDICNEFRERFLQIGVACFTPNWDSPPMWAHYANNWQGFAIEYCTEQLNIANTRENDVFWQFWVNYSSRVEQASLSELLFSPYEAVARILSAKTLPWPYEQEWRLIHLDGGEKVVKVPIGMKMTGIVLGPKSPSEQSQLFLEKCPEWGIHLSQVNVGLDKTLHMRNLYSGSPLAGVPRNQIGYPA